MPRWAAKVDGNHQEIAGMIAACGWTVVSLARLGGGVPDLLISKQGRTVLVEVKTATGKLRTAQKDFAAHWQGEIAVVRDWEDVLILNQSGQATAQPTRGGSAVTPGDSA